MHTFRNKKLVSLKTSPTENVANDWNREWLTEKNQVYSDSCLTWTGNKCGAINNRKLICNKCFTEKQAGQQYVKRGDASNNEDVPRKSNDTKPQKQLLWSALLKHPNTIDSVLRLPHQHALIIFSLSFTFFDEAYEEKPQVYFFSPLLLPHNSKTHIPLRADV